MATECNLQKKNIGKTTCNKVPQLAKYMIETPNDFVLTPANLASASALKTALQTAIKESASERIYLWPAFSRVERADEATIYVESPLGSRKVRDGNYRARYFTAKSLCTHKQMYSHNRTDGRVIFIDIELNMLLTEDSDGNYRGLSIDLLNTEKLKISGGDDLTESPIYVSLANNREIDESGFLFDGAAVLELEPLTDVELAIVGNPTATTFRISVKNACDGTPVSGLVQADFVILDGSGNAQTPTSFSEPSNDGIYTIVKSTNFVDGTVNLVAAASLSLDAYESTGSVVLNIP